MPKRKKKNRFFTSTSTCTRRRFCDQTGTAASLQTAKPLWLELTAQFSPFHFQISASCSQLFSNFFCLNSFPFIHRLPQSLSFSLLSFSLSARKKDPVHNPTIDNVGQRRRRLYAGAGAGEGVSYTSGDPEFNLPKEVDVREDQEKQH